MPLITEDPETFSSRFPKQFWKVINKQYFEDIPPVTTQQIIAALHGSLLRNAYYPSKPRYYIDKDKGHGVLRRIPVLEPRDYAVYFYCLSMLEDVLAYNRVDNTYGGWSLNGLLRKSEDEQMRPLLGEIVIIHPDDKSIPTFSYNEYAWAAYYGDYQKKLYATLKECVRSSSHLNYVAVQFDIANFYDNIRLNILEKNLRSMCRKDDTPVIDLLCHFLKYWNRDVNGYDAQQTGISQDAFADCSRILANYYLQDYDEAISKYCKSSDAIYFRYADDQIIIARDMIAAKDALHKASIELSKIGLNINKSKVYYRSVAELIEHFSFTEFRQLHENKNNREVLTSITRRYLSSINLDKKHSLLNKILGSNINLLRQDLRTRVLADAFEEEFITLYSRSWTLERIYKWLQPDEKKHFLEYLKALTDDIEFSNFHFEVLSFLRKVKQPTADLIERIKFLQSKWS